MKKLISIVAIAALVFSTTTVGYADSSGTVDVTVKIQKELSIEITGTTPIDFGTMGVDTVNVAPSGGDNVLTVKNDGSGVPETIEVAVTVDPSGWTRGTENGVEKYNIQFQFTAGTSPPGDADANWKEPEDPNLAKSLDYDEATNLWVKLKTPTKTAKEDVQTATLTISAQ